MPDLTPVYRRASIGSPERAQWNHERLARLYFWLMAGLGAAIIIRVLTS